MCYNLGADENLSSAQQQAYTPADEFDATVYGDLFQWGRWKDGHEKRNSSTTSGTTTNNKPGSDFITVSSGSDNWYSGTNADALWSDGTDRGINDPCPDGFRVPSIAQWQSIAGGLIWDSSSPNLWTWKDTSTKGWQIGDFLFLPMAGYRNSIALVDYQGTYGLYWSSTVTGTDAYYLHFMDGSVYLDSRTSRAEGSSVRCVVD
jgi:uncharacterized protein (TIGR02145 family)